MNAAGGYHVHAQVVGRADTIEMAAPTRVLTNLARTQSHDFRANWVPRFPEAYRLQMQAWVDARRAGRCIGTSARDGFVTTSIAEQIVDGMNTGARIVLTLPARSRLYA